MVVIAEATGARGGRARGHGEIWVHVVEHRGLAAPVGTRDGDQLGPIAQGLEVQGQGSQAQAIPDPAKPLERQRK